MSATRKCPECGTELPIEFPLNACPKCLLKVGLGSQPEPAGAATVLAPHPQVEPGALPVPGHQFGHYQIIRILGKGGMGAVYEAQDLETGRRVALKVLGHSLDSPEARKRFLREGRLAASINHPNSVYVYGTEEIEGAPAIAMEFVTGGTLQERVQSRGPLLVPEAVDALLQIIAGLEAAQAIGILHRDIKPANCFVDSDGAVKVGDFGLSISTAARGETNLTVSGSFMGTPAFSSPEQLRGEELNVRSDIYAAGVTLYYLLTGRTPFQSENMVQLLASVLERPAESPAKWRREIPKGLCQAVLHCLEKQPAERFKTYAELRQALLPFSSIAATPATLGLRFLAGCIDLLFLTGISILTTLLLFQDLEAVMSPDGFRNSKFLLSSSASSLFWLLYYGVPEGIWGASLGKAICRLRVVGSNRNFPGVPRALLRAAVFYLPPALPTWLFFAFGASGSFSAPIVLKSVAVSLSYYLILALLFATARRKNGFAGIHDLLSRTRVVLKSAYLARPGLEAMEEKPASPEAAPMIGPYHVLEVLEKTGPEEMLLGYDTRLLRKVWIRKLPVGAPPVASHLRNLARVGRLRWLNGNRSSEESWDAYEAVPGKPLLNIINERQPWSRVRFWLLDLAEEINAGLKDQSLSPALELDRVWIGTEGRAKLLDFPVPGRGAHHPQPERTALAEVPPICDGGHDPQRFLSQAAVAALEGRVVGAEEARPAEVAWPLPLHARAVLSELQAGLSPNSLVDRLKPLLNKVAFVSRWRRLGLIAGCSAVPLIVMVGFVFGQSMLKQVTKKQPDLFALGECLGLLQALKQNTKTNDSTALRQREAFELYVAGRFRQTITNPATWTTLAARALIPEKQRSLAEQVVATHPAPSDTELKEATSIVESLLGKGPANRESVLGGKSPDTKGAQTTFFEFSTPMFILTMAAGTFVIYVGIPSVLAGLLFRGGLILRAFGVAVAKKDGMRASRLRILWRNLITWSPFVLMFILFVMLMTPLSGSLWKGVLAIGVIITLVVLIVWSALLPERSLQDRLAGTCLVPR